jgi:hypothetical protein
MLHTMPFQNHTTWIESNVVHRLEKMFYKFCSKVPPSPLHVFYNSSENKTNLAKGENLSIADL